MSWKVANSIMGGVAVLLLGALGFVACKGVSGGVGGGGSIGDFTFEGYIGNDGKTHWEGNGPNNLCVCIEFLDKDGNVIGHGTMSQGSGAGVVDGRAIMWRAKTIDCAQLSSCGGGSGGGSGGGGTGGGGTGGGGTGGGGSGGGMFEIGDATDASLLAFDPQAQKIGGTQDPRVALARPAGVWQKVWVGTVEIDEFDGGDGASQIHNSFGEFEVLTTNPNGPDAYLAVWPLVMMGPGTNVPTNVRVNYLAQMLPETFGGRMVFARRAPFTQFSCEVNSQPNYAVLGQNVTDLPLANGWHIIEVVVPLADMHLTDGIANTVNVTSRAVGETSARYDQGFNILLP